MTTLSEIRSSRELFWNLTLRELRSKYKRSVFGWLWSLLNPLATMLIFSLVFRLFLRIEPPVGDPSGLHEFAFFLLCGLLPYNMLATSLTGGMSTLTGNSNLVKKVWFPRELLIGAHTTATTVGFLIEMGVLAAALLLVGNFVIPWLIPVLLVVALQVVFVCGLALIASIINVYFRDLEHLMGIALQVWFYASPIIYPQSLVVDALKDKPDWIYTLYRLNPLTRFVEAYRALLYDLRFPDLDTILILVGYSAASLIIGLAVFRRFEGRLAEEL